MKFKKIKREDAEDRGLKFFYTGRFCKWEHLAPRYTSKGARLSADSNAASGLCYECVQLMDKNGKIGQTFEEILHGWDNSSEVEGAVFLPTLSGTSGMGYQIIGKTLIDKDWWDSASKWLWIEDANHYIKTSLSRGNMERNGHSPVKGKRRSIQLHRFIMGVNSEVDLMVDHISGDTKDNRTCNLRLTNREDNTANSKLTRNSITGYIGVDLVSGCKNNPYRSRLFRGKSRVFCEHHPAAISAAEAYDKFLSENYPSEFNRYNFL